MAQEDVTLMERDAKNILKELLEAMNQAYFLGVEFEIAPHEVEAIRKTYPDPREFLLQVILAFLRQAEPRPTWRAIVDALRSPLVNLTALAERVEAAHFPDNTATRPPPPATVPPTASVQTSITDPAQQVSVTPENSEKNKTAAVNLTALAERVETAHFPDLTATLPPPPATASVQASTIEAAQQFDLPPKVVAEFDRPEDFEQFRQEYASYYDLHNFTMMLEKIRSGSFIVTWFVTKSVVKNLKGKVPRAILKKYSVAKLEIAGTCVYRLRKPQEAVPSTSTGPVSAAIPTVPGATPSLSSPKPVSEEDNLFVEAPSEDFYCPVTLDLLLEPHLTSCCGKHLSQEAATRIQGGGGSCPLCKAPSWSTMLNKHFQRQGKSLYVFCHHGKRGFGWQGELGTLDSHVQSCTMRDAPTMTELLKLSLYGGYGTQVPHQEQSAVRVTALQFAYRTVSSAKSAAHTSQKDPVTPLTAAARKGDIEEELRLLQNGEDPNPSTDSTPLKEASTRGDSEMALALLEAGAEPNYVTDDWTALMEACRVGKTEMVELLINHGADPNTVNDSYWTALMAASNRGHYEAVDFLLQRGANPNMQDNTGWSALLGAVYMRHDEIVLRLLEAGARPDIQDKTQMSALMHAVVHYAQERVMDALLASKPDLDHQDKFGETALILACKMRNPNFVRKLLSKGANRNIWNKDGDTPLLIATALSQAKIVVEGVDEEEIVEALLQAEADQTKGVERPLILAAYVGNGHIVQFLLKHGADIYKRDENGVAAFEVAEMEMFRNLSNTLNPKQLSSRTPRGKCKWTKKRLRSVLKQLKRGPLLFDESRSKTGVASFPEKFVPN